MPSFHERTALFAHFLESDTKLWVRFVPALPLQAAYYYDAHVEDGGLHRFLLHLTKREDAERRSCRLALEIGSHIPSRGGLIFDVTSTACEVAVDASGCDFSDAKWPMLDDPFTRKAHNIVVMCRDRYGPAPGGASDVPASAVQ